MASKFKNKTKAQYEKMGYKVVSLVKLSEAGLTDLMCLKDGKSIFIECKEADDTLKPLQEYKIDLLIELGFEAFCLQDGKGKIYPIDKLRCKCDVPFMDCKNAVEAPHGDKWYCSKDLHHDKNTKSIF